MKSPLVWITHLPRDSSGYDWARATLVYIPNCTTPSPQSRKPSSRSCVAIVAPEMTKTPTTTTTTTTTPTTTHTTTTTATHTTTTHTTIHTTTHTTTHTTHSTHSTHTTTQCNGDGMTHDGEPVSSISLPLHTFSPATLFHSLPSFHALSNSSSKTDPMNVFVDVVDIQTGARLTTTTSSSSSSHAHASLSSSSVLKLRSDIAGIAVQIATNDVVVVDLENTRVHCVMSSPSVTHLKSGYLPTCFASGTVC